MFNLKIEKPVLDQYSKRQRNADVFCQCCGRGIPDRETCQVVITAGVNENGETIFKNIQDFWPIGRDSAEWGNFVGTHCAKRIPKEYKVSQKKVRKAWAKNGCP